MHEDCRTIFLISVVDVMYQCHRSTELPERWIIRADFTSLDLYESIGCRRSHVSSELWHYNTNRAVL
jgi:hypothetical protein